MCYLDIGEEEAGEEEKGVTYECLRNYTVYSQNKYEIIEYNMKFKRTHNELVAALDRHLQLLTEYYKNCFIRGNTTYFGEVAGKLRLLVCEKKNNEALLMHVARIYGLAEKYRIKDDAKISDSGVGCTLEEYLNMVSVQINIDGEMVPVSIKNEILIHAEKEGAAHEDLEHPEILYRMKQFQITVNEIKIHHVKIMNTARHVIAIGYRILHDIKSSRV